MYYVRILKLYNHFFVLIGMNSKTTGDRIGRQAKEKAQDKSQGRCLSYVGNAFRRAIGESEGPIGIQSPKDCDQFFKKRGCKQISTPNQYENGDIVIFQPFTDSNGVYHKHGHIQVYYNGRWISDFKQNNFSPYRQTPNFRVLRYEPQTYIKVNYNKLPLLEPIPINSSSNNFYDFNVRRSDTGSSFTFSQKEPSYLERINAQVQSGSGGPNFRFSIPISIPCSIM